MKTTGDFFVLRTLSHILRNIYTIVSFGGKRYGNMYIIINHLMNVQIVCFDMAGLVDLILSEGWYHIKYIMWMFVESLHYFDSLWVVT